MKKRKIFISFFIILYLLTFTNSVFADVDGSTVQIGRESIEDYSSQIYGNLNYATDCLSGLYNIVSDPNTSWGSKYNWVNNDVWEKDFTDSYYDGNDYRLTDDVDLAAYCGHGLGEPIFKLNDSSHDSSNVYQSKMRLGNRDLEWFLLFTCNSFNSSAYIDTLKTMRGVHMLCGFSTDMTVTANGGNRFAYYAKQGISVKESWFASMDDEQAWYHYNTAACSYKTTNANDRLWGYGSVGSDPVSYVTNSSGYVVTYYNCY